MFNKIINLANRFRVFTFNLSVSYFLDYQISL